MEKKEVKMVSGSDLLSEMVKYISDYEKLITVESEIVTIYHDSTQSRSYDLDMSEINTIQGLIGRIHHLSAKIWITPKHIKRLIEVSGVSIYG